MRSNFFSGSMFGMVCFALVLLCNGVRVHTTQHLKNVKVTDCGPYGLDVTHSDGFTEHMHVDAINAPSCDLLKKDHWDLDLYPENILSEDMIVKGRERHDTGDGGSDQYTLGFCKESPQSPGTLFCVNGQPVRKGSAE